MARAREILASLVLLAAVSLMMGGERLWTWATSRPVGEEMLITAVVEGDLKTARRAIAAGASLEARSPFGLTPLAIAASGGDQLLVTCLIGHGADVDALTEDGCPALTYAALVSGDIDVIRTLLDAGADPNGGSGDSKAAVPPLVGAVTAGHEAAVEILLESGADPNLRGAGSNKSTPLTAAAASEVPSERVLRRLITAGADVNQPDGGGLTPLRAATQAGHADLASILRAAGARGGRELSFPA